MKAIVWYWVIGCILLGAGMGSRSNRCPDEKLGAAEALLFAATWPAVIGMAFTLKDTTPPKCDTQS